MREGTLRSPLHDLRKDLYAVARDAEALLKATADVANEQVQEIRARTERTLRETLEHLDTGRLRSAARNADEYVREHSWPVVRSSSGDRPDHRHAGAPFGSGRRCHGA